MRILVCGESVSGVLQELNRYAKRHREVILCQASVKGLEEILQKRLMPFPVAILVLNVSDFRILELAKQINVINPYCQIIFVGRNYKALPQVYETKHVYFMLYRNVVKELEHAMERALVNYDYNKRDFPIPIYCRGIKYFVVPRDIQYIEVQGRTISIHMVCGKVYKTNQSLKKFCELLPSGFVRTHNSYVVNKNQVLALEHSQCILQDEIQIPISRLYKERVYQELNFGKI